MAGKGPELLRAIAALDPRDQFGLDELQEPIGAARRRQLGIVFFVLVGRQVARPVGVEDADDDHRRHAPVARRNSTVVTVWPNCARHRDTARERAPVRSLAGSPDHHLPCLAHDRRVEEELANCDGCLGRCMVDVSEQHGADRQGALESSCRKPSLLGDSGGDNDASRGLRGTS